MIGQGILIAISPILTRLFSPGDFALLAIITALSGVLSALATLSWDVAIVLPEREEDARALAYLGLLSSICIGVVLLVLTWLLRNPISELFDAPALADYWWVIPTTVLSIGAYRVYSAWLVRRQDYAGVAWRNLSQGVGQASFNLTFGFLGIAPLGLLGGLAAGRIVALSVMRGMGGVFRRPWPSLTVFRSVARRYQRFPLLTTGSYTIASVGTQLPVLLFASLFSLTEMGLLALAMRVLASPVGIIADAVRQYYEGRLGHVLRTDNGRRDEAVGMFSRLGRNLFLMSLAPAVVLIVWGPELFSLVFGESWAGAGDFARIMAVFYLCQIVVSPLSGTLTLLERQRLQLIWDCCRAVAGCTAIVGAALLDLSLSVAVLGYAITQSVAYILLYLMMSRVVRSLDG